MTARSLLIERLSQTGESHKQFAQSVGVSEGAVQNFLRRGRIQREGKAIKKIKAALKGSPVFTTKPVSQVEEAVNATEAKPMRTTRLISSVYNSDMNYQDKEELAALLLNQK